MIRMIPHLPFDISEATKPSAPCFRVQHFVFVALTLGFEEVAVAVAAAIVALGVEDNFQTGRQTGDLDLVGDSTGRPSSNILRCRIGTEFGFAPRFRASLCPYLRLCRIGLRSIPRQRVQIDDDGAIGERPSDRPAILIVKPSVCPRMRLDECDYCRRAYRSGPSPCAPRGSGKASEGQRPAPASCSGKGSRAALLRPALPSLGAEGRDSAAFAARAAFYDCLEALSIAVRYGATIRGPSPYRAA